MKKGLKIFLWIWGVLGVLFISGGIFFFVLYSNVMSARFSYDGEKISVERDYTGDYENGLITKAEGLECFADQFKLPCFNFDAIQERIDATEKYNAEGHGKSVMAIHYNAIVLKDSGWPEGAAAGKEGDVWFGLGTVYYDEAGQVVDSGTCMAKLTDQHYWVVRQRMETFSGTPKALASSGIEATRHVLFNKQGNPICQAVASIDWIS